MKYIDEIQLKELSDILQDKLQANDAQGARQIALEMAKKGKQIGPRAIKKTMLAQSVLDELNHKGRVSRKTQLALDDQSRIAELPE